MPVRSRLMRNVRLQIVKLFDYTGLLEYMGMNYFIAFVAFSSKKFVIFTKN